jgi:hypothetical protein
LVQRTQSSAEASPQMWQVKPEVVEDSWVTVVWQVRA